MFHTQLKKSSQPPPNGHLYPDEVGTHEHFMRRALELAALGEGYTSPNPMVGAVVVRDGAIVGEGYHHRAGEAHAEVAALSQAGSAANGATLYVSLEPCNHHGRTPPCTEAILQAGIRRVFYAVQDANPKVSGSGHRRLQGAGVEVHCGPLTQEARHLNRFFFHYITTGRPYVVAKFAASLDGKIATRTGDSQWITGPAARTRGHYLRQICDAIAVGVNTVITDNPSLTVRHPDYPKPKHPLRIVLDSSGRAPDCAKLFDRNLPGDTVVATTDRSPISQRVALGLKGIEVMLLPTTAKDRVDLDALMIELRRRQVMSLLVEGGGELLASFFEAGLVNEVWAFVAPLIIGGEGAPGPLRGLGSATLGEAHRIECPQIEILDRDILVQGRLRANPSHPSSSYVQGNGLANPLPERSCTCSPAS